MIKTGWEKSRSLYEKVSFEFLWIWVSKCYEIGIWYAYQVGAYKLGDQSLLEVGAYK